MNRWRCAGRKKELLTADSLGYMMIIRAHMKVDSVAMVLRGTRVLKLEVPTGPRAPSRGYTKLKGKSDSTLALRKAYKVLENYCYLDDDSMQVQ